MSRNRKHLVYSYPGSKRAAKAQRKIWWTLALVTGIVTATLMGLLIYHKDHF